VRRTGRNWCIARGAIDKTRVANPRYKKVGYNGG
jgi:hypothetical protein